MASVTHVTESGAREVTAIGVHAPLEAPQSYLDEYHEVNDTARQKTCAMISAMDVFSS